MFAFPFRSVPCRRNFFVYCGRFQSVVIMKKRYYPITLRRRLVDERQHQVPVEFVVVEEPKKSKKSNKNDE